MGVLGLVLLDGSFGGVYINVVHKVHNCDRAELSCRRNVSPPQPLHVL